MVGRRSVCCHYLTMPNATDQLVATIEQIIQDIKINDPDFVLLDYGVPDYKWIYDKLDYALTWNGDYLDVFIFRVEEAMYDIRAVLHRIPKYIWVYNRLLKARRRHPFKFFWHEMRFNITDAEFWNREEKAGTIQALARGVLTRRKIHFALLSADADALRRIM